MFAPALSRSWYWATDASGNWTDATKWVGAAASDLARVDFNGGSGDLTANFTTTATVRSTWSATAGINGGGGILASSSEANGSNENLTAPISMAVGDTIVVSAMFKTNTTTGTSNLQVCGVGIVGAPSTDIFGVGVGNSISFTLRAGSATPTAGLLALCTSVVVAGSNTNTTRGTTFTAKQDFWYRLELHLTKSATANTFVASLYLYECGSDGIQTPRLYRAATNISLTHATLYGAANVYAGAHLRQLANTPIQTPAFDQFNVQRLLTRSNAAAPNHAGDAVRIGRNPGVSSLANRTLTLDTDLTVAHLELHSYTTALNIAPAASQKIVAQSADGSADFAYMAASNVASTVSAALEVRAALQFLSFTSANPGVRVISSVVSGAGNLIFNCPAGIIDFTNAANTGTGQIIVRGTSSFTGPAFNHIASFNATVLLGDALSNPNDFKCIWLGAGTHTNNFDATQAPGAYAGAVGRPQIRTRDNASVTLSGTITFGNTVSAAQNVRMDLCTVGGTLTVSGKISSAAFASTLTWGGNAGSNNSSVYIPTNSTNDYAVSNIIVAGTLLLRASVPASGASIIGSVASTTMLQMADGSVTAGNAPTTTAAILIDGGDYTLASGRGLMLNAASGVAFQSYTVGVNTAHNATWAGAITTNTTAVTYPLRLTAPSGGTCTFSGVISKDAAATALTVEKIGAGLCVLSATNTYTGATTVTAGELRVNGSIASGAPVTCNGGALSGTGTVNGNATVNNVAGSSIQGGTGSGNAGTLAVGGNLSFGGSTARLRVTSTGAAASRVTVGGTTALGGCTVDLLDAMNVGTYDLIVGTGVMSGTLPTIGTNSSGRTAALSQVGNTLRLTLT